MQKTDYIWQNGKFVPWDDAKIHVLSHTLHYGGGAFEGIRFYNTEKGPAIFRLEEHVDRLFYSANAIGMKLEYSKKEVADIILELIRKNKIKEGYIRPLLYYGYGSLGVAATDNPVEMIIACWPWGSYLPHDRVDVKTSKYIRIHPRTTIADAKLCGNYLNGQLASIEIAGTHYHEALFLDAEDYIAEGVGENLFLVKNGSISTPRLGTILAGITRSTIMEIAQHIGITVMERQCRLDDAYNADEAFFTGTAAEVTPIRSLDDKIVGTEGVSPITDKIKQLYAAVVRGEEKAFEHYLTYV